MTTKEFGALIKTKYPQYKDKSDEEVGTKMLAKYPDYKSKITSASTPEQKKSLLAKTTDIVNSIFPGKQLGNAIGTSAQGIYQAVKTGSMEPLYQAGRENNANYGKIVGDTANIVGDIGTSVVPPAATIAGKAAQFGGLAAFSGAGASAAKGNTLKQIALDSFQAGLIGAAIGTLAGVAEKGIKAVLTKSPEAIYNNALGVSNKIKNAGKSPAPFLKDKNVWGSLGTFKKAAQEGIETESSRISSKLSMVNGGQTYNDIKAKAMEKLAKDVGSLYSKPELEKLIENVPVAALRDAGTIVPYKGIWEINSQLGHLMGDRSWLQANPTQNVRAAKAVYGAMADAIKGASNTTQEFSNLANWYNTKKVVDNTINIADKKFGIGLYDLIGGSIGFASGDSLEDRVKYGLLGVGVERGIRSPALQTGIAQLVSKIGQIPVDSVGKISKTAVTQLLGQFFSENPGKQP
jgi:hypothetical protein